jgi:hypothetical protein
VKPIGKTESATFNEGTKRLIVTGVDLPTMVRPDVSQLTGDYG